MLQKRKPHSAILDDEVDPDLDQMGKQASLLKGPKPLLKLAPGAKLPLTTLTSAIKLDESRFLLVSGSQASKNPNYLFEDDEETKRLKQEAIEVATHAN